MSTTRARSSRKQKRSACPTCILTKSRFRLSPRSCWAARRPPCPPSYQYKPGDARHDIQEGWWMVKKYNCMGCHQFTPGQNTILMGMARYQDVAGTTASEAPDRRRARRSRVAAEFLSNPSLSTDRHEPQWRAAVPASAHADVLVLGQRAAQAGALLPGAVAAAHAVYSGAGADRSRPKKRTWRAACSRAQRRPA